MNGNTMNGGGHMNQMNQMNTKPASQRWDDQHMINDLLSTEKHLAGEYGNLLVEGSTQQIRDLLTQNMKETACDQFQVYQQMEQRGWYPMKAAQQPDIQTAKQKFTQMKSQLM